MKDSDHKSLEFAYKQIECEFRTMTPVLELEDKIFSFIQKAQSSAWEEGIGLGLYLSAQYHISNKERDRSNNELESAKKIVDRIGSKELTTRIHSANAILFFNEGKLDEAYIHTQLTLELAAETKDEYLLTVGKEVLANIYSTYGLDDEALKLLLEIDEICTKNNFLIVQSRTLYKLSELFITNSRWAEAEEIIIKANDVNKILGNSDIQQRLDIRHVTFMVETHRFDEAQGILDNILKSGIEKKSSNFGSICTLLGIISSKKEKDKEAIRYFIEAVSIFASLKLSHLESNALSYLSKFYFESHEFDNAIEAALKANELAENVRHSYMQLESLQLIYLAYKGASEYSEALKYHERYFELSEEKSKNSLKQQLEFYSLETEFRKKLVEIDAQKKESELLRIELQHKERDLATKTIYLVNQTELLSKFRDDLRMVVRDGSTAEDVVRGVKIKLKELPCSTIDWEEYDEQFRSVHPHFRNNLLDRFSDLSEIEVKICSLLRVNLTSNDIARLLCLSQRNIENHRYRIRKKLNLESEDNIHRFLETF